MNARFNILLPDALLERIEQVAQKEGKTKSRLIRELIEEKIDVDVRVSIQEIEEKLKEIEDRLRKVELKQDN